MTLQPSITELIGGPAPGAVLGSVCSLGPRSRPLSGCMLGWVMEGGLSWASPTLYSISFHRERLAAQLSPRLLTQLLPRNYFLAFLFWVQISQT